MSSNNLNQSPFLRTTRSFPKDSDKLPLEMDKSYLDIANAVNNRVIGIYTTNTPTTTGESWFYNKAQKQQTLRKLYSITSSAAFNHGLNFNSIASFTKITGIGFDGTNYYPIPYVSPTGADCIGIYVNSTQVVLTVGGGSPPALVRALIVLEWLSNV